MIVWLLHLGVQFNKPVHIDDYHYVASAEYLLQHPLHPLCNRINWIETPVIAYREVINPPLYLYVQAGWMLVFGKSIRGLHVLASLFVLLAAISGCRIGWRF